jgi:hypothetical protein
MYAAYQIDVRGQYWIRVGPIRAALLLASVYTALIYTIPIITKKNFYFFTQIKRDPPRKIFFSIVAKLQCGFCVIFFRKVWIFSSVNNP